MKITTTPSGSPFHRGRADYQAVSPPVEGGVRGGLITKRFPLLWKEGLGEVVV